MAPIPNFCTQRRFIFIHVPRTGGGSVEAAIGCTGGGEGRLGNYLNGHAKLAWFPEDIRRECYKFSVVRNPWERLFSVYKWDSRQSTAFIDGGAASFAHWYHESREKLDETQQWHMGLLPHVEYMSVGGSIAVDRILRFEKLAAEVRALAKDHPEIVVRPLHHIHQTVSLDHREFYTDSFRREIEKDFEQDIAAFGYRFED